MKNTKVTNKITKLLINLGETQANEFCTLIGFYEPKISANIIKKNK